MEYIRTNPAYDDLYKEYIRLKLGRYVLLVLALAGILSGSLSAGVIIVSFCAACGFYIQRSIRKYIAVFVAIYEKKSRE